MKLTIFTPALILLLFACSNTNQQDPIEDLTPYENSITIQAGSYHLPLNEYGRTLLSTKSDLGGEVIGKTTYYANGIKIDGNVFTPADTGIYSIKGVYLDLESPPIEIRVSPDRNKKILVEYFTSGICGWCPWIGSRLDSLDVYDESVISYSIHGQDELSTPEAEPLQEFLSVFDRPAVRVNRGYVRNYAAPLQIRGLVDSVRFLVSKQTPVQIKIESILNESELQISVSSKYFEIPSEPFFLTVAIVEDNIVSYGQYNYFSGANYAGCPYNDQPDPLASYSNHNTLRQLLTETKGNVLELGGIEMDKEIKVANLTYEIPPGVDLHSSYIIAFIHQRRENIDNSAIINAQIVKFGETVDFME